ncbi:MAG TPA: hypothetical protein VFK28_01175 [Sphingomicrobium sp.]|nr:hypothetical protein [Sphingomicrobium sp.]
MSGGRTSSSGSRGQPAALRQRCRAAQRSTGVSLLINGCFALLLGSAGPCFAASNNVRITGLTDVAFGTVANLSADAVQSQSLCLYANTASNGYNVRASGSGAGGTFSLSSGADELPFEVQWNGTAGQSSGTQLAANVALSGLTTAATQQTCNSGPAVSASLVVILRSAALSSASAGSYNGSLTLLIGPE